MFWTFERTLLEHPENAEYNFMDSLSLEVFDYIVYLGDQIINTRLQQLVSYLTFRLEGETKGVTMEVRSTRRRMGGKKGGRMEGLSFSCCYNLGIMDAYDYLVFLWHYMKTEKFVAFIDRVSLELHIP